MLSVADLWNSVARPRCSMATAAPSMRSETSGWEWADSRKRCCRTDMGLRGPAPKPTSLVVLEGNRGRRPINDREPKPRAVRPKCPAYLDEAGQKEWKRLIPILTRMRILTEADGIA